MDPSSTRLSKRRAGHIDRRTPRLAEQSSNSVVARAGDANSVISPGGVRQLERHHAIVVGPGERMDVHAVLKSVRDHVLAQELHVLRRGLDAPCFRGPVASQGKARRGADVRAHVEEFAAFKPGHAGQLKLINHAGEQLCCRSWSP